ncbi:MAG: DUF222 domain-containing protein [Thermoanaerobaculia bacterium]
MGAAREKVRVAKALGELPRLSEAMRCGELSYSKIRALTRVATPDNEEELLGFAEAGTATHVETLVRAWRRVDRLDELEHENQRHASRYLQAHTDEDGMVVLRARLDPEVAAAVLKALEAAEQVLFDQERETKNELGDGVPASPRRADALGSVAESALAHDLDKGTRADRLQVVVHVDEKVLADPAEPGVSMLEDGTDVSAETSPLTPAGRGTGRFEMPWLSRSVRGRGQAPPLQHQRAPTRTGGYEKLQDARSCCTSSLCSSCSWLGASCSSNGGATGAHPQRSKAPECRAIRISRAVPSGAWR